MRSVSRNQRFLTGLISTVLTVLLLSCLLSSLGFSQDEEVDIAKHLGAGKELYQKGRFENALKEFVMVLQKNPTDEEAIQYIERCQIKIKELREISKALVLDDRVPALRRGAISEIEVQPSYYNEELKRLAEKMTKLIEKTKAESGKTTKEEVLKKREAEERFNKVKEYFDEGERLYNEGKPKEAITAWEKALEIAGKGDPSTALFIDELKERIEKEKELEDKRKEGILAREREEKARVEKERLERDRQEREKIEEERRLEEERKEKERIEEEKEIREEKGRIKEGGARRFEEGRGLEKRAYKEAKLWAAGIIFVSIFVIVLLVSLLLRKPGKKIESHLEVEKKEKMFEQAKPEKGFFRARKLRDVIGKKKPEEPENNNKRKNLFDNGE